jgi:hypothetical protein
MCEIVSFVFVLRFHTVIWDSALNLSIAFAHVK